MKIKTRVKAGGVDSENTGKPPLKADEIEGENQTMARGLKIKTGVKAGPVNDPGDPGSSGGSTTKPY